MKINDRFAQMSINIFALSAIWAFTILISIISIVLTVELVRQMWSYILFPTLSLICIIAAIIYTVLSVIRVGDNGITLYALSKKRSRLIGWEEIYNVTVKEAEGRSGNLYTLTIYACGRKIAIVQFTEAFMAIIKYSEKCPRLKYLIDKEIKDNCIML